MRKLIEKLERALEMSFGQGNVVRKCVWVQTRQLQTRPLNIGQRYCDKDIQLNDYLRTIGRNI